MPVYGIAENRALQAEESVELSLVRSKHLKKSSVHSRSGLIAPGRGCGRFFPQDLIARHDQPEPDVFGIHLQYVDVPEPRLLSMHMNMGHPGNNLSSGFLKERELCLKGVALQEK